MPGRDLHLLLLQTHLLSSIIKYCLSFMRKTTLNAWQLWIVNFDSDLAMTEIRLIYWPLLLSYKISGQTLFAQVTSAVASTKTYSFQLTRLVKFSRSMCFQKYYHAKLLYSESFAYILTHVQHFQEQRERSSFPGSITPIIN